MPWFHVLLLLSNGVTQLVHHYSCLLLHVLLPSIARSYHACDISLTCFIINTNMADVVGLCMLFYMYMRQNKKSIFEKRMFFFFFFFLKQSCCMSQLSFYGYIKSSFICCLICIFVFVYVHCIHIEIMTLRIETQVARGGEGLCTPWQFRSQPQFIHSAYTTGMLQPI